MVLSPRISVLVPRQDLIFNLICHGLLLCSMRRDVIARFVVIGYAVTQENHMLVGENDIDAEGSDTR
jgi:hypothetical protein